MQSDRRPFIILGRWQQESRFQMVNKGLRTRANTKKSDGSKKKRQTIPYHWADRGCWPSLWTPASRHWVFWWAETSWLDSIWTAQDWNWLVRLSYGSPKPTFTSDRHELESRIQILKLRRIKKVSWPQWLANTRVLAERPEFECPLLSGLIEDFELFDHVLFHCSCDAVDRLDKGDQVADRCVQLAIQATQT
jgi:hypothetical protein